MLEEDSNDFDTSITSQGIDIFSKEKAGRATHNKEKHKHIRVFLTREELILSKVCIQRGVIDRVIQRDENILFTSVKTALRETIRKLGSKGLKSKDVDFCIILGMLTSNIGLLDFAPYPPSLMTSQSLLSIQ